MKCSHLSNLLSNLLLRNKWMILVPVAVTFILFTRQKLHSISSISERKGRRLFNNGGKMLRVGCKGFTRKNSGSKLCGGEGREIEKRYSCGNIGYARKINIHKNGWAKIPNWYGKATPFAVTGAFFSSQLLIVVTLWNSLLFINNWPILKISVSTNSDVKPCRWKGSLSNVLGGISNTTLCAWENGRITDDGSSSSVAGFLPWIQMATASRAVNVTRRVM